MVLHFSAIMEEMTNFTGLSPAAFFTIIGLMVFVYQIVSSMFVSPQELNKPPTVPVAFSDRPSSGFFNGLSSSPDSASGAPPQQLGRLTEQQLKTYDGSDPSKPLLIAIRGQIYDVSSGRMFYGRGGPYAMFAGRDASRALALLSFKPQDINGNIEGLGEDELEILQDWEFKFMEKYSKVGELVSEETLNGSSESDHTTQLDVKQEGEGNSETQDETRKMR